MNWTNYDRLVQHLETMPPERFDYSDDASLARPGCVDCQCRILMGEMEFDWSGCGTSIAAFLSVTDDEAYYIWLPTQDGDPYSGECEGVHAIANALHRLRVVAAKYPRPETASDHRLVAFASANPLDGVKPQVTAPRWPSGDEPGRTLSLADRESAFLATVRAIAQTPVEQE